MSDPVKIFLSYSHRDEELKDELVKHLGGLRRKGLIEIWHDRKILAGTEWADEIDKKLEQANIILFLVSADFIDSPYCFDIEMTKALKRHNANTIYVIPVIVRDCDWAHAPFAKLQAVPTDGKAVMTWGSDRYAQDKAWTVVAKEIGKIAQEILAELEIVQKAEKITQPTETLSQAKVVDTAELQETESLSELAHFTENLGNGITLDMVKIPGGTFQMGSGEHESEQPIHSVTISPFCIGKYPVTQAQYEAVMGTTPSHFKGKKLPVECVSWYDSVEFCKRLSENTGSTYRLPSEAEWEYACRAGTTTSYHSGETITSKLANFDGKIGQTTELGIFPPNAFGLYDMHGNVWEWCEDHWHSDYQGAPSDSSVWRSSENEVRHVLRGGSWIDDPGGCSSASRNWDSADARCDGVGFRVVYAPAGVLL